MTNWPVMTLRASVQPPPARSACGDNTPCQDNWRTVFFDVHLLIRAGVATYTGSFITVTLTNTETEISTLFVIRN